MSFNNIFVTNSIICTTAILFLIFNEIQDGHTKSKIKIPNQLDEIYTKKYYVLLYYST